MDVATSINSFQQVFVNFIRSLETKANETHLNFSGKLKTGISHAEISKLLGKSDMTTNVCLKMYFVSLIFAFLLLTYLEVGDAIKTQDEPKLECAETTAEWDLPVTVVWCVSLLVVFQVQWVHVERIDDPVWILQPHCGAVKVYQQPLVGIKVE